MHPISIEVRKEGEVIKEVEGILKEKVPALLEPFLFRDSNKVSLPSQVNPLTEDNLKNTLWYALEECNARGEVNLGKGFGRIDLLCDNSDVRVGIECKDEFLKNIGKKDFDYANSSVLNVLYFASFGIGDYEFSLDYVEATIMGKVPALTALRRYFFGKSAAEQYDPNLKYGEHKGIGRGELPPVAKEMQKRAIESDPEYQELKSNKLKSLMTKYRENINIPAPYGIILYNPLGELWIAKNAESLISTSSQYSPTKEAFVKYLAWKYFKKLGYVVATECELPGAVEHEMRHVIRDVSHGAIKLPESVPQRTRTGHNTIDITAMPKSNLNETNPSKLGIIGVECKASINKDKL